MKTQTVVAVSAGLAAVGWLAGCASEPVGKPCGKETVACHSPHSRACERRGKVPPGVAMGVGQARQPGPVGEALTQNEPRRGIGASSPAMQEGPGSRNQLGNGPLYDANDNLNWEEAPPVGR